jgi:hypothetical protein
MNREQAIKAIADKIGLSGPFTNNLVDAMAAVGVLKLDEVALVRTAYGQKIETAGNTVLPRVSSAAGCLRYNVTIKRWREWPGKPGTNILNHTGTPVFSAVSIF